MTKPFAHKKGDHGSWLQDGDQEIAYMIVFVPSKMTQNDNFGGLLIDQNGMLTSICCIVTWSLWGVAKPASSWSLLFTCVCLIVSCPSTILELVEGKIHPSKPLILVAENPDPHLNHKPHPISEKRTGFLKNILVYEPCYNVSLRICRSIHWNQVNPTSTMPSAPFGTSMWSIKDFSPHDGRRRPSSGLDPRRYNWGCSSSCGLYMVI